MRRRTEHITSGRLRLALHVLAEGEGRPLLLLHGLGDQTGAERPAWTVGWTGPVLGLDFTGHGGSDIPAAGGYTPENLMADVDAVLAVHGPVCIVGRGLGAWVALLIAGARPQLVRGVVLADGTGLAGGGPEPPSPHVASMPARPPGPPDPYALFELSRDVRPPDYAMDFVRFVTEESDLEAPIVVSSRIRPPWVEAVVDAVGVIDLPLEEAVAHLARTAT